MNSEIMIDVPHTCEVCGETVYVSGGIFYYELEINEELYFSTDEFPACPLCGGGLSPAVEDAD